MTGQLREIRHTQGPHATVLTHDRFEGTWLLGSRPRRITIPDPVRENTDHPVALERHLGTNVSQLRTEEGK